MERELRAKLEEVGVDVQTLEEVHFSSVRQAEQRNNEEGHGAKTSSPRMRSIRTFGSFPRQPFCNACAVYSRPKALCNKKFHVRERVITKKVYGSKVTAFVVRS